MDRTILHCDCNGFYASVECVMNPSLKNVPMAVGGDQESRHGIILAKNEIAKKYNIQTAQTIYQAKQQCPELIIVPPHHDIYKEYSVRINEIYRRYTDLVEPFSIDESWLDVTESRTLFGDGKTIADELRAVVEEETGLTISAGVSFNKVFAKLGSDYKKPNATTVFSRENWQSKIFPLPASDLLYVGKTTNKMLESLGIKTIGDIAKTDEKMLIKHLGKHGRMLYIYANALDGSPVRSIYEGKEIKSIGNGITFRQDLIGEREICHGVNILSDSIAMRMRKHGLKCTTVQVHIKTPQFKTISRQKKLDAPTYLSKQISDTAMEIIKASWNMKNPIRMITVTGSNLIAENQIAEQISFFDNVEITEKRNKLEKTMDSLRSKFGRHTVDFGYNYNEDK